MTGSYIGLDNPDVAKVLQAQLDVIGEVLNASKEGFAIWKALPTQGGEIEEFELVLMNSAGAAAAGKPQQELAGRTLTSVVGVSAHQLREFGRDLRLRSVVPLG